MSCEGRALAHALCRACFLHSCCPYGLWSATTESTGEGGTPALLLSLRVKFGGNMIVRKLLGGAADAADFRPLMFFKSLIPTDV